MDNNSHNLWFSLLHKSPYTSNDPNFPDIQSLNGIDDLAINHEIVLGELQNYLSQFGFESHFNRTMVEKPKSWKVRSLRVWGVEMFGIQKFFPETMKLLGKIDNVVNVGFNLLEPRARIKPHFGDTNGIIRCHLGLIIPVDDKVCGIKVNNEVRVWERGKILAFTDAYEHEAWNDTDQQRVILLFDIVKPEFRTEKNKICGVVLASLYLQKLGNVFPKLYSVNPKYVRLFTYTFSFFMRMAFPVRNYLKG